MSHEQMLLAEVKNLENQVRLFLYENYFLPEKKELLPSILNLASNVTPIQYLVKEIMRLDKDLFKTNDEGDYPYQYTTNVMYHLNMIIEEFRLLAPKGCWAIRVSKVWHSIYDILKGLEDWTGFDLAIYAHDEFLRYLDAE